MRKVAQFRVAQYKAYNARLQVSQEVWTKMRRNYSGSDLGGKRGRAGSAPPPLGDGQTPSLTVMLANAKFWSSTVKHGAQNGQNDCRQWLYDSFRVHQIRFRPGLRPGPNWGRLQRSRDPLAGSGDPTSEGEGRRGRGERERRRGEEGKGRDRSPTFRKFLDPPRLFIIIIFIYYANWHTTSHAEKAQCIQHIHVETHYKPFKHSNTQDVKTKQR